MIKDYIHLIFISIADILCLNLGSLIVKKYIRKVPHKLIPILIVFVSVTCTCIWGTSMSHEHSYFICAYRGLLYGLAAVGLHQLIKQTKNYIITYAYIKKNKEKGKNIK